MHEKEFILRAIKIALCGAIAFFLTGCQSSKVVVFEHDPSEVFYETRNFDANELSYFKDDGVLFVVDVKEAKPGEYWVWLGLYSEDPGASVELVQATLSEGGFSISNNFDVSVDLTESKVDLYSNSVKLFVINLDDVKNLEGVDVELIYRLSGDQGTLNFRLDKKVESHTVFPT
ncbi:hypothetical protein ACJO2E_16950 [Marinobacter sp. M1N3S26]|uniref:hypothetical protein n=1 Tax=Marinobacter sp. M1N3S26 TaxID=3382299 RepID=UPI00387B4BE3